jgi:hypothetical protein
MTLRELIRYHLLKVLLILVVIQIVIVIIIQNYKQPPKAMPDRVSMIEGRTIKITPLSNDIDKDIDNEIKIEDISTPIHGSVKQKEKTLYYTPNNGFIGTDSFTYTISNG